MAAVAALATPGAAEAQTDTTKPTLSISSLQNTIFEGTPANFQIGDSDGTCSSEPVTVKVNVAQTGYYVLSKQLGDREVKLTNADCDFGVELALDSVDEPNGTLTVTLLPGSGYNLNPAAAKITRTVEDDDTTTVRLTATGTDIPEAGGSKTFTVTLGRPLADGEALPVELLFSVEGSGDGAGSGLGADFTLTAGSKAGGVAFTDFDSTNATTKPPTITFTGGTGAASSATFTLTAKQDTIEEQYQKFGETAEEEFKVSLSGLGSNSGTNLGGGAQADSNFRDASFHILDDDNATPQDGLVFSRNAIVAVIGGASQDYTVKLATNPNLTGSATVTVAPALPEVPFPRGVTVTFTPSLLSFNRSNWNQSQKVTVKVTDGPFFIAPESVNIVHTVTGYGNFGNTLQLPLTTQLPAAGLDITRTSLSLNSGATTTYKVRLKSEIESWDQITVTPISSDMRVATVSGPLTFTSTDWNVQQTVTVTGGSRGGAAQILHDTDSRGPPYGPDNPFAPVAVTVRATSLPTLTLSATPATMAEDGSVTLTAELDRPISPAKDTAFELRYLNGTAEDEDYTKVTAITIPSGLSSGTATLAADNEKAGEEIYEGEETLSVRILGHPSTVTLGDPSSVDIAITDEADAPTVSIGESRRTVTVAEGATGDDAEVQLFLRKVGNTEKVAEVTVAAVDGTATSGADYDPPKAPGNKVTFPATGGTNKEFQFPKFTPVKDDSVDEPSEQFTLVLQNPVGAQFGEAETVTATVTITDNDPTKVTLSSPTTAIAEDGGSQTLTVALGRALVDGESLTVPLDFTGAATFGEDYSLSAPGTLPTGVTFQNLNSDDLAAKPPAVVFTGKDKASATATLKLTATDDKIDEGAGEGVAITLGALDKDSGAGLGGGASGSGTASFDITDDDAPAGITLSVDTDPNTDGDQTTVAENASPAPTVTVTATVDGTIRFGTDQTVTVSVGGGTSTATADTDYTAVADFTIKIPAGADSATGSFTLTPTGDLAAEPNETILVEGAAGDATVTVTGATITLIDTSTRPELTVSAGSDITEGANAVFTVKADTPPPVDTTVNFALAQTGQFVAGDVLTATTSVVFKADQASQTVEIATVKDAVDELDGDLTLTLKAAGNSEYTLGTAVTDKVAIADDDATAVALTAATDPVQLAEGDATTRKILTVTLGRALAAGEKVEIPLDITTTTGAAIAATNPANRDFEISLPSDSHANVTLRHARTAQPKIKFTGAAATPATATVEISATARDDDDQQHEALAIALGDFAAAGLDTKLSGGAAGETGKTSVAVQILDDDAVPDVTLTVDTDGNQNGDQTEVAENASPAPTVTVTATIDGGETFKNALPVTVTVGGGDSTATKDTDYKAVADFTITIPANTASATGTFLLEDTRDDVLAETDETIQVDGTLSGAAVTGAVVTLTDTTPTAVASVVKVGAQPVEGGNASFRITVSPAPSAPLDVQLQVSETSGNYVDADDKGVKTVTVPISGTATHTVTTQANNRDDANGEVTVTLIRTDDYRVDSAAATAFVPVHDNDPTPVRLERKCSDDCYPIAENGGQTDLWVYLQRALDLDSQSVTIPLTVTGGTVGTHYRLEALDPGNPNVELLTEAPYSLQNPAVRLTGAGTRGTDLRITAIDNGDTNQRTLEFQVGTPIPEKLFGGVSVAPGTALASVPIADDDGTPAVRIEVDSTAAQAPEDTLVEFRLFANPVPTSDLTVTVTAVLENTEFASNSGIRTAGDHTFTIAANQTGPTAGSVRLVTPGDTPNGSLGLRVKPGTGYTAVPGQSEASIGMIDRDGGPTVSVAAGAGVNEGGDAVFTVTRSADGAAPGYQGPPKVRLRIRERGDFVAAEHLGVREVEFTGSALTASVVVPTIDDNTGEKDGAVTVTLLEQGDSRYTYARAYAPANEAAVAVADDDGAAGAGVLFYNAPVALSEGGVAGSYNVELATDPGQTATLTVNVPAAHQDAVTVQAPGGAAGSSATLTFTSGASGTWDEPQTLTVAPLEDDDGADESFALTHQIQNYPAVSSAADVQVSVEDFGYGLALERADFGTLPVGADGESYTVRLLSRPSSDVVVTPVGSSPELNLSSPLTFTPANWKTPRIVEARVADDFDYYNKSYTITHTVQSSDSNYSGLTALPQVRFTAIFDSRGVVNLSASPTTVAEGGEVTLKVTSSLPNTDRSGKAIPLVYTLGTAEADDFTEVKRITIPPNGSEGTAKLSTTDDAEYEHPHETFTVALGDLGSGFRPGSNRSVVISIDDASDSSYNVSLSAAPNPVAEGAGVTLTAMLNQALDPPRAIAIPLQPSIHLRHR